METTPKFYAHVDITNSAIMAISPAPLKNDSGDEIISIELDFSLAEKFLLGTENVMSWIPVSRDGIIELISKDSLKTEKVQRIDGLSMYEITEDDPLKADVKIEVGLRDNIAHVFYKEDVIRQRRKPIKLYFTSEGNPHYLKKTVELSTAALNELAKAKGTGEWINPIEVDVLGATDLSVFTLKNDLKMSIIRHDI